MTSNPKSVLVEEKWNAYSHALGIFLSIAGIIVFFQKDLKDIPFLFASLLVYSISLVVLFTASTCYHAVRNPKLKNKLRILDHISIYYLIAGTYTPVCLLVLSESRGWLLFFIVWGIALFGTILKIFFTGKFETFSLILYGIMGWLIVVDLNYLFEKLPNNTLFLLGLGGAFYTLGIIFYALKRILYNHLIWHFFVLGGAISHWLMIHEIIL